MSSLSQIPYHFQVGQQEFGKKGQMFQYTPIIPCTECLLTNTLLNEELFRS